MKVIIAAGIFWPILVYSACSYYAGVSGINQISFVVKNANFSFDLNLEIIAAFSVIALSANFYAIISGRGKDSLLGNIYYTATIVTITTNDYLILFCGIEFMLVTAMAMFVIDGSVKGITAAKRYFLVHIASSSFVLLGVCFSVANATKIDLIATSAVTVPWFAYCMLTGLIINTGNLPLSSWVVKCYSQASDTSLLYLTSFTTKASCILIMKFFCGQYFLKYFGSMLIAYALYKALLESNIKRYISFVNLMQIGIITLLLSTKDIDPDLLVKFVSLHILQNALFNLSVIASYNNPSSLIYKLVMAIAALLMTSFPFSPSFYIENKLLATLPSYYSYCMLLSNFLLIITLPLKEIKSNKLKKEGCYKASCSLIILIFYIFQHFVDAEYIGSSSEHDNHLVEQLVATATGFILTRFINRNYLRQILPNLDLFGLIEHKFTMLIHYQKERTRTKICIGRGFLPIIRDKLYLYYDQRSAIFIIFMLFIALSFFLQINLN